MHSTLVSLQADHACLVSKSFPPVKVALLLGVGLTHYILQNPLCLSHASAQYVDFYCGSDPDYHGSVR